MKPMKTIFVTLALFATCGCDSGPTYDEALATLVSEQKLLEQMVADKEAMIVQREQDVKLLDSHRSSEIIESSNSLDELGESVNYDSEEYREKLKLHQLLRTSIFDEREELRKKRIAEIVEEFRPINGEIKKQQDVIAKAKQLRDSLSGQ